MQKEKSPFLFSASQTPNWEQEQAHKNNDKIGEGIERIVTFCPKNSSPSHLATTCRNKRVLVALLVRAAPGWRLSWPSQSYTSGCSRLLGHSGAKWPRWFPSPGHGSFPVGVGRAHLDLAVMVKGIQDLCGQCFQVICQGHHLPPQSEKNLSELPNLEVASPKSEMQDFCHWVLSSLPKVHTKPSHPKNTSLRYPSQLLWRLTGCSPESCLLALPRVSEGRRWGCCHSAQRAAGLGSGTPQRKARGPRRVRCHDSRWPGCAARQGPHAAGSVPGGSPGGPSPCGLSEGSAPNSSSSALWARVRQHGRQWGRKVKICTRNAGFVLVWAFFSSIFFFDTNSIWIKSTI